MYEEVDSACFSIGLCSCFGRLWGERYLQGKNYRTCWKYRGICLFRRRISATGKKITISSGEGLGDTEVLLSPVNEDVETGYVATYLTPGMPVEFDAVMREWFKIGVSMQNDTDTDKTFYVEIEGVEVRIE